MDWGFGNPNKTAAFIAILMMAIWMLPVVRRWLFWVALPAFIWLGGCLLHTMSRGGVVAAGVGYGVLLLYLRSMRPWHRGKAIAVVVAVGVMLVLASATVARTSTRFAQSHTDRSVSNRLVIWSQAPRMMLDAPWGWGIGNSGATYMGWYQPLENTESYRTLVNSHLTWLVELGWPLRLLYLCGWGAVFVLCSGSRLVNRTKAFLLCGVAGGLWAAFFVAALFSSVAEVPTLWILPMLSLAGVLVMRSAQHLWPSRRVWAMGGCIVALMLVALIVCGTVTPAPAGVGSFVVSRSGGICVGARTPKTWVVVDTSVEKAETVIDTYRCYRRQQAHPSAGFAPSAAALPVQLTGCTLAVLGAINDWDTLLMRAKTCKELLLIAPDAFPDDLILPGGIPVRVVFGEFTRRSSAAAWRERGDVDMLEGLGDFLPNWTELVF